MIGRLNAPYGVWLQRLHGIASRRRTYVCIVRGVPSLGEVRSIYPAIGAEVPFVRLFDLAFSATVALARQRLVKAVSSTAGRYRGVAVG